ncbi:MAG: isoprenylcysteine carboxylmethyltransferase family protein [Synergistaceae bacterium]|jgi:protein-S-isoprenylcysteine O-methyltransferase Ste14|nr:isoprenylcysteine carboxylmethyltransferase family protein [Synergistaceae bacterium]
MMKIIERYRTRISQALGLVYILVFALSEKKLETTAPTVTGIMIIAGCVLVGIGIVGRLWCAQYIAGYKTDSLITGGPYSVCRNPLYFFSFIGGTGVALCTESITLALILPALFAVIYPVTIFQEEKNLLAAHGETYRRYMYSVPRFIPKWSLFHEPPEYMVRTKIFRREAIDAVYFASAVGLFEMIEELINFGIIRTFFVLY